MRRLLVRLLPLPATTIVAGVLLLTPTGIADAAWVVGGSGAGGATAAVMPTGLTPTGSATGSSVTLRWPAVTLTDGAPVQGYVVSRYNAASGTQATVGAGCSGVVTSTGCTESGVPPGTWVYTDTPVVQSWNGGQSPPSAPIVVPLT
jgi:hypothetical protein